ncbi:MAG: Rieske (2Fe-2S) protein [Frankiaceae bacterium]|jgi:ubiquinol-cytochrome c reductase iron-sulfur subunit|nr:Rieske (2Fe-2S) protein [Frankiaceae bacterium]
MSLTDEHGGKHSANQDPHGQPAARLTGEDFAAMSTEEAMIAAAREDGVVLVRRRNRFPIPGTKAEKRAERGVTLCFLLAFIAAVGFIVAFIALPWKYEVPTGGIPASHWYTPLLGVLLAVALLGVGVGAILWAKWLMPDEEAIQDRHDGPSASGDSAAIEATLTQGIEDLGVKRRSMIKATLGLAGGALLALPLVSLVGGMIKKPGNKMFTTMWSQNTPMVYGDGRRVSPDDLAPGGIATVFPGVAGGLQASDAPVLLLRLRPGQTVKSRKGQADFGWGEYVAYSKICTHAGCPASLFEQQTTRLLCPCHQSQFEVLLDAKPVFGPATRSLPKLPIDVELVDGQNYFVSRSDFTEAVGPGFWERP